MLVLIRHHTLKWNLGDVCLLIGIARCNRQLFIWLTRS